MAADAGSARPSSPYTRLRRHPERGRHDLDTLHAILDEGIHCHLGFVSAGRPYVLPTIHARSGDAIYIHGSPASRMLDAAAGGFDCCLTVTLVDGLVLARSAFAHSLNYRSAVVLGRATDVTEPAELEIAQAAIVEHVARGRWDEVRRPSPRETRATRILRLPITEYSCKVRTGPPNDPAEDLELDVWAGVLPLRTVPGDPEASPDLRPGLPVPRSVRGYGRPG